MWKPASKTSCKFLFERFVSNEVKLTQAQLRSILDRMCVKKDGSISDNTKKTFEKLYEALDRGEFPSKLEMFKVIGAMNKPFFRKKKPEPETENLPVVEKAKFPRKPVPVKVPLV